MTGISGSLKKLDLFSKKEKKQSKTQILIQIIERIEKENPEKTEQLQDIKIDLMEKIPLSEEKKKFLKNEIGILKKGKKPPVKSKKKKEIKFDYNIPNHEDIINTWITSLESIRHIIKKIDKNSDSLYQELKIVEEDHKLEQIKERNNLLQNNLRSIISNLHITYSDIANQINEAKSLQTKMAIFDNEMDMKRKFLEQ